MMLFSKPRFDAQGGGVKYKLASRFRMRAAVVAVMSGLAMTPWYAGAAGLGRITVLSNLGQPLRAEVEVSATREELAGMTARLAPHEAFRQASVDFAGSLLDLRFALDKRPNGNSVIRISSVKPINEPFLDFLVELNWSAGRMVREYTFLLDPPEVAAKGAGGAVSVAEAKPVANVRGGQETESAPAARPAPRAEAQADAQPQAQAQLQPQAKARPQPRAEDEAAKGEKATHLVRTGETLHRIASENRYDGVSLEQMLIGLYRANSDAFIAANPNRMKAGAILNIPDKDAIAAIPEGEARKEFRAQAADWNAYRQKLAAAAAQSPARDEAGSQSAGGRITAKVEERTPAAEASKDQVRVARNDAGGKGAKAGGRNEEDLIAKDKALKEAQERLSLLEKNTNDLQKLLEMKNQKLAELQKQLSAKAPETPKVPAAPPPPEAAKPTAPEKPAEPPKAAEAVIPPEPPKPVAPPPAPEKAKPAEPPKAKPAPAPLPPLEAEEPSLFDDMTLPLAGGGAIAVLLAGYVLAKRRRTAAAVAGGQMASSLDPSSLGPVSVFGATGGQSIDTGNTTPQHTDFSQTGPGTIDTDEVDPVAEADVYMAYGRDAQAEEILLEALQKDPQRTAIHAKLLEIYAGRKSLKQFETLAGELYAQTGGIGPEWAKVAAMGLKLEPQNPLYAASGSGEAFDADATLVVPPGDARMAATVEKAVAPPPAAADETAAPPPADALAFELPPESPAAVKPTDEAPAPAADLLSLDFEMPSRQGDTIAPEMHVTSSEPVSEALDFDLGFDTPVGDAPPGTAPEAAPAEVSAFDFDFETPPPQDFVEGAALQLQQALRAAETAPAGGLEAAVPLAAASAEAGPDAGQVSDFDFDIEPPAAAGDFTLEAQPETAAFDLGSLADAAPAFDLGLPEAGEVPSASAFDLGAISLDLAEQEPVALAGAETPEPELEFVIDEPEPVAHDPRWEEVNTKLDLAKAYEEMGDQEGARELLQEVVGEGTPDLVEQAKSILERLKA